MAELIVILIITGAALYIVTGKKRLPLFLRVVGFSVLTAGIYGVLIDQISYTLSPEFFTQFKFIKFGFASEEDKVLLTYPRFWVILTGFLSSCKMGAVIGVIIGAFVPKKVDISYVKYVLKILGAFLFSTFMLGIIGYLYGYYYLSEKGVNWHLPDHIVDLKSFISVAMMQQFCLKGGFYAVYGYLIYFGWKEYKKNKALLDE